MADYSLSNEADADIEEIAEATLLQWGHAQAEKYILSLHGAFERLAELPDLGRDVSHIRRGYRQIETASHSVFYRKTVHGILIVRVLHQHMDFDRHL